MSFSKSTHHRRPPCIQLHHILLLSFLLLGLFPGYNNHPRQQQHLASAGSLFNKDKDKNKNKNKPSSSNETPASQEELQAAQDLQDAATGTITSTPPGKTKEPQTCDEMMAKSVVEATTARDKAIAMKDSAIEMASTELKRADKLAEEIKKANIQVEAVDEEMVRMKKIHSKRIDENNKENKAALLKMQNECLATQVRSRKIMEQLEFDTEKKMDAVKKKATEEIRRKRSEAKKEIAHVKGEMEELRQSTAQQIKEVEEKAATERQKLLNQTQTLELTSAQMVDEVKQAALDDVTKAKNDAAVAIAAAEEQAAKVKKDAEDLVERIQNETDAKLAAAKKENELKLEAAEEMVRTERDAAEKAAAERVEEMDRDANQRVRIATAELKSYKISSAMQIEQTKKEAEESVRAKEKESEEKMVDFYKKAAAKIQEANTNAEKGIKQYEDQLKISQKQATQREKKLTEMCHTQAQDIATKSKSEISTIQEEMKLFKEKIQNDVTKTVDEKKKVEKELNSQIKDKSTRIGVLEWDVARLKRALEDSRDELSHWKTLHDIRSYINITHIMEDLGTGIGIGLGKTEVALRKATKAVEKKLDPTLVRLANHWEEFKGKMGEIWDPYGQKISALYDAHLKTTVDTKIRPVLVSLSKKIAIVYEKQVIPLAATVKDHGNMVLQQIRKKLDAAFVSASKTLQQLALSSSKHLKKNDPDEWIPSFVHRGLQRVGDDSSWYLSLFLKILSVIVLYLSRRSLMNLVWGILCVPFKIVRFFLTPVIGSGNPKINSVKNKKENRKEFVRANGVRNLKMVKREESGISYDSDSESEY